MNSSEIKEALKNQYCQPEWILGLKYQMQQAA